MTRQVILLFLLAICSISSYGQNDLEVSSFHCNCLETLSDSDTTKIDALRIIIKRNKLIVDFRVDINCAHENVGRVWISNDTLNIIETDIKVNIEERDSLLTDGTKLKIIEETRNRMYAFCTCRTSFHYEILNPKSDFNYFNFNGRIRKL